MMAPGQVVGGRWQILARVAEGRWSSMYRVTSAGQRAERALELFRAGAVARAATEEIARDAALAARVDSPFVVAVVEAGWDDAAGAPFVVTAPPEGETLRAHLAAAGPLSPDRLSLYCDHLGRALTQAANAGVVHRALRPECLYLATTHDGRPLLRVSGFASGRALEASRAFAEDLALSTFAPPELVSGERVTFATDVWPLATIAYEALTALPGAELWGAATPAEMAARIRERPPVPSLRAKHALPAGFDAWFAECVAVDPTHRYSNAEDALARLRELLQQGIPSKPATSLGGSVKTFVMGEKGGAQPAPGGAPDAPDAVAPRRIDTRFQVKSFLGPVDPLAKEDLVPSGVPSGKSRVPLVVGGVLLVLGLSAVGLFVVPALRGGGAIAEDGGGQAATSHAADALAPPASNPWVAIAPPPEPKKWLVGIDDPDAPLSFVGERPGKAKKDNDHAPSKPFRIQAHEVTWGEIEAWLTTRAARPPWAPSSPGDPSLPVTGIPWSEAQAYCESKLVGGELPKEEQWEYAARGPERDLHPWGDKPDFDALARMQGEGGHVAEVKLSGDPDRSYFDVFGLFGNAQEWTADQYDDDLPGQEIEGAARDFKVVRGVPLVGTPDDAWTFAYRVPVCARGSCDPMVARSGDAPAPVLRFRHLVVPVPEADEYGAALPRLVSSALAKLRACFEGEAAHHAVSFAIVYEQRSKATAPAVSVEGDALSTQARDCVQKAAAARVDGVDADMWWSGGDEKWRATFSAEWLERTPPDLSRIGFRCVKDG